MFSTLRIATILFLLSLGIVTPAQSATLILSGSTLIGAEDVVVLGRYYNVSFVDGSFNSLFASPTSAPLEPLGGSVYMASHALMEQVFLGAYDDNSLPTNGCSAGTWCGIRTYYQFNATSAFYAWAFNDTVEASDSGFRYAVYGETLRDNSSAWVWNGLDNYTTAVWTYTHGTTPPLPDPVYPSPVPLPASAPLFGLACAGLLLARRRFYARAH